jgi:thiamine biosynthesis lipoprotein
VGLDYIVVNEKRVKKLKEEVNINLNNLIPSYQVDAIANLLKAHGIQNFCIQLGNETLFRGSSAHKEPWKIVQKIATHQSVDNLLDVHIHLQDKAIAILQNYTTQDYTIQEHSTDRLDIIIDPLTGQLATNSFIAAFVFAEDCITARAYATAFMAKSFPAASNIVESIAGIDLFFIYKDAAEAIKFYHSPGLQIQHIESSNKVVIQKSDIKPSNTPSTDSTKEEKKS